MDMKDIFWMQKELDKHIYEEHPVQEGEDRIKKKILALLVEIGELANETKCFKYWSNKPPAPREITLEEYVDVLHFILSLGLDIEYDKITLSSFTTGEYSLPTLEEQFIYVYEEVINLKDCIEEMNEDVCIQYELVMASFIGLGEKLGFTWEEIAKAYEDKNTKNHVRQQTGY